MSGYTDGALAARVEAGWAAAGEASALAFAAARPGAVVAVEPLGGGSAVFLGVGSPLSQAQGLGLAGPVDEADLDRLVAFYHGRGATAAVEVATFADPALWPALGRRGFRVAEVTHVQVRPVVRGGEPDPASLAPGLSVARLEPDDPDGRAACHAAVMGGFFEGPEPPPDGLLEVMDALTAAPDASAWLAREASTGEAAGGASLLLQHGIALFAGDATLPAFRRRGAQHALIAARLRESAAAGCDLAAVCTVPGTSSHRNYERLGFRTVYARILMGCEP